MVNDGAAITGGRLAGKVAIVTGAARAQGEAEARLFAAEGARVLLGDVLDAEGEAVAADIGPSAVFRHLDVRDGADWKAVVALAEERFGPVSVLVNNAGINPMNPIETLEEEEFRQVLDVNLVGQFLGIKAVLPSMRAAGGGSIVNISSINGYVATHGLAAYTASKFGVRGLTKAAAVELGEYGIRANSIHPGAIDTAMIRIAPGITDEMLTETFGSYPLQRVGQPIEIARLALWLASDESSYSTGGEFLADGGMMAGTRGPKSRDEYEARGGGIG
jgi:3alpha(or 20beta)-hydroxysteroid dehydrogenase